MNVTYRNSNTGSVSNPANLSAYGTVTAGDVLLIQISLDSTTVTVTGVTGGGNTWVLADATDVGGVRFETWWVSSALAAATTPVVSFSGAPNFVYHQYRISNITAVSLGPVNTIDVATAALTVQLAPVTLASGGTAFTIARQTATRFTAGWTDTFANGTDAGTTSVDIRGGFRTEHYAFDAVPGITFAATTQARSHTVVVYGTTTVTRLFPARAYPGTKMFGPLNGTWNNGTEVSSWTREQIYYEMFSSKVEAGLYITTQFTTNQENNYDFNTFTVITKPLAAATLSGTFQLCAGLGCHWIDDAIISTVLNTAQLKVHAYISVGSTPVPRTVIIDNHTESVNITATTDTYGVWTSLDSALAVAGDIEEGDRIIIEVGIRIVDSPTPTPTYPPEAYSRVSCVLVSPNKTATEAYPDAIPGAVNLLQAGWVQFSQILSFAAGSAAPDNDSCADFIIIATLPYQSSFIDTTGSTDDNKAVWYVWVPPTSGEVIINSLGSNYMVDINVYTGFCGSLVPVSGLSGSDYTGLRNFGYFVLDAVEATQYFIELKQVVDSEAPNHGGVLRFGMCYRDIVPQTDDIYMHAGWLVAIRDEHIINIMPYFLDYVSSGVSIDYSGKTLYPLYEPETPHTDYRIVIGLFGLDGIEILDLATFNLRTSEIDFEYDWNTTQTAQVHVSRDGFVYVGAFGNGFLHVIGAGTLPAILDQVSDPTSYAYINRMDLLELEDQPGGALDPAPTEYATEDGPTAAWAFTLDEDNGIIYYTTGGYYIDPVTVVGNDIIRRFNINTSSQMTDFATVVLVGSRNTGLKGLRLLPDGGLLVANGSVVTRLDSSGAVVQSYTPSNPLDHQSTVDVELVSDRTLFWMYDLDTTRMTQFNVETGVEVTSFQPYLQIGTSVQIAVYTPTPTEPEPEPEDRGGIYFINPDESHDIYYTENKKIPNPTIRTALLGE